MAIGRTYEESLLKAIRSLEYGVHHLGLPDGNDFKLEYILKGIAKAGDERLFFIGEALRRGVSPEEIHNMTKIDMFFLNKMQNIIEIEHELKNNKGNMDMLLFAKRYGFSDKVIAHRWDITEDEIYRLRQENGIRPVFKMVDTCAAEFKSETPYFYSTYEEENESIPSDRKKIVVLGSGPIRIGQEVEFDYATVHAVMAIKESGYEAIIINNNPETVSTDFSISDKLYFEPLTEEDVMEIINLEKPEGVVVQFGGQTAINLAEKLAKHGVRILGTALEEIDNAENRDKFEELLRELEIPQPLGKTASDTETAVANAREIGYPVLVRPSYVLGGRAMEIVYREEELRHYMENAVRVSPDHPILTDRYLVGKEVEVDAISDGETVIIPGIMEHIERAGVHSGDSIAVYPPQNITEDQKKVLTDYTIRLAKGLNIVGLLNIQYVISEGEVFVLEVNPRSSRTVPFLSKITEIPMANLAMQAILGEKLKDVDTTLGPEMKSTGEVMGSDVNLEKSLYKGLISAGIKVKEQGNILFTVSEKDKGEALQLAERFTELGYMLLATEGTAAYFKNNGLKVETVGKIGKSDYSVLDAVYGTKVDMIINTPNKEVSAARDGFKIRRAASEQGIVCLTSLDTANALLKVLESMSFNIQVI